MKLAPEDGRQRFVIRGVNWLGDAVMSTAALLRLREARPDDLIAVLTPEKLADLWRGHPAVDQVLTFATSESAFAVARRVRAGRFQTGLVLPNSFRSAVELWWAGVPERIGYAGQLRSVLLTRKVPPRSGAVRMRKRSEREILNLTRSSRAPIQNPKSKIQNPQAHHVWQYLHLAMVLGARDEAIAPRLFVKQEEVRAFLEKHDIGVDPRHPLFGLNPGAEYGPAKRWPAERFVAAAREIQERTGCRWLIFGGKADRQLAEGLKSGLEKNPPPVFSNASRPVINLAGATSLRELCAGLQACEVLVTNDTGPMHVAAAVGTPVVGLFGSTSPELTGPGLPGDPRHRLLQSAVSCSPCYLRECPIDFRCMGQIGVAEVVAAALAAARR